MPRNKIDSPAIDKITALTGYKLLRRIESPPAPRIAPANPPDTFAAPAHRAVFAHRTDHVVTARRLESAIAADERTQRPLVNTHEHDDQLARQVPDNAGRAAENILLRWLGFMHERKTHGCHWLCQCDLRLSLVEKRDWQSQWHPKARILLLKQRQSFPLLARFAYLWVSFFPRLGRAWWITAQAAKHLGRHIDQRRAQFGQRRWFGGAGDRDQIDARRELLLLPAKRLAEQTLPAVPRYGLADTPRDGQTQACMR